METLQLGSGDLRDPNSNALSDELVEVQKLALDLRDVLSSLKDYYKEHGVKLPPGTTTTLRDIAQRLVDTAENAKTLELERDQSRALVDVAALINSSLDLTQVLNEVMDTIIKLTGAERGYLMLSNEDTGEMELRIARNMERQTLDSSDFEVSRNVVERVATSGQGIVTTNAQEDTRFKDSKSVVSYALRSILCVPLKVKGNVTGVIYADNKIHAGLFNDDLLSLMRAFANQAAIAIENARLFARVTASLDAITELKSLQDDIFASIASGVITTNKDWYVTLINRRAQQILQVEEELSDAKSLQDVLPIQDPRFQTIIETISASGEHLMNVEFDTYFGDEELNLSMNFSPLKDAYNHTQGVAIVLDDLTEEKRREAQIAGVRRYLPMEVVDGIESADRLKLGGTRQEISIFFADIRGFSSFSEGIEPERLVELVNDYMTIASNAIHIHQGVIDKFMGDAVMALYNTPLRPQADHALRAARTALAVKQEVTQYHQQIHPDNRLMFGIGIHTGEAVVGNVGSPERLDYTAMGDSVNLAKRLQEVAAPQQILISDSTYQMIADYVEVVELKPMQVKGRSQYTDVYELISVQ